MTYRDDRLGEATFNWKDTKQTVDVLSVRPSDWTAHIRTVTGFTTQVPMGNLQPITADDNFALFYEEWEASEAPETEAEAAYYRSLVDPALPDLFETQSCPWCGMSRESHDD